MLRIIQSRNVFLVLGGMFFIFSLVALLLFPKNYGIDMTWGTQSEYVYQGNIVFRDIQNTIDTQKDIFNTQEGSNIINTLSVYEIYAEPKIIVEAGFNDVWDETKLETYKQKFQSQITTYLLSYNENIALSKYTNIGKSFGDYIKKTAFITLGLALVGITIYVWWAFAGVAVWVSAMSFAVVVIVTQLLDVLVASGLYVVFSNIFNEFKIDTFFITALLTILGFSINNTIVVFDRVRENIRQYVKTKKFDEIINLSVTETIKRSIYTSATLLFVLVAIYIFGAESLRGFMMVMIFWVVFGTFSSLCVAPSLLYVLNSWKELKVYEKKIVSDDDKIVV